MILSPEQIETINRLNLDIKVSNMANDQASFDFHLVAIIVFYVSIYFKRLFDQSKPQPDGYNRQ